MSRPLAELCAVVEQTLRDSGLEFEQPATGKFLVTLPGVKKLRTVVGLIVGEHALRVEAFVCRQPDENREQMWAYLLQQNARTYGVSYSIDPVGDVYLTGRLGHGSITPEEIDTILGSVLTYADEHFNTLLEIGFGTSIRKEWDWRVARGEPLTNLEAFAAFADPARTPRPITHYSRPDETDDDRPVSHR
ncbi:YbjN domain-containing protein [Modestobacter sp. I12A-02628]|uniref:YbjN domain-containing protein n=1 Tax=Goekera deserti TaxID=2497753 RepID=A0A7K3W8R9_9ACTN|nr:YbjN domain-containing protein [Goekera deserti]MPR00472.1 YbjN domain-containing protein [Goekera deserti]NDI49130.1 YbjN domain-containing protein [Goekera deserti]NEL52868.1 YbjN domain-containing protein [Goekera deserti]